MHEVRVLLFGLMACSMTIAVYRSPQRWRMTVHLLVVAIWGAIIGVAVGALLKNEILAKELCVLCFLVAGIAASVRGIILGSPKTGLPTGKLPEVNQ